MSELQPKRTAPKPVNPVSHDGIIYSAPTSLNMMGSVEARDAKTNNLLWTTRIYSVTYQPELETDVQDVFITKLEVSNEKLLVTNEANQEYQVDLKTGKVI